MKKPRRRELARDAAVEPLEADPAPKGEGLADQAGLAAAERAGVHLTNPRRVIYPAQGVTKATMVAYYAAIAERMLPYIANRPLSLVRCSQEGSNDCYYQKHDSGGFPEEMKTILITEKGGDRKDYFYIDDLPGLIAGTQMNVMEWHVWGAPCDDLERPDRIVFDIDPGEGVVFASVRDAARDIRRALESVGLTSFPLITGGKGMHVVAPLVRRARWPEVKAFCRGFAKGLELADSDRFIATASKAKRKGKLFIDYLRNERGATAIAPWSSRARQGAPVATPLHWDELDAVGAADGVSLDEAVERARAQDPWQGYASVQQSITTPMLALAATGMKRRTSRG